MMKQRRNPLLLHLHRLLLLPHHLLHHPLLSPSMFPPSLPLKQRGVSVLILYDCFLHFNNKRIPHPVWRFDPSDLVLSVPSSLNFLRRRDRAGNADRNGESHEGSNKGLLDFRTFSFWFQQQTKKKPTNFRCTVSCKYVTRQNWHWFDWSSFRS